MESISLTLAGIWNKCGKKKASLNYHSSRGLANLAYIHFARLAVFSIKNKKGAGRSLFCARINAIPSIFPGRGESGRHSGTRPRGQWSIMSCCRCLAWDQREIRRKQCFYCRWRQFPLIKISPYSTLCGVYLECLEIKEYTRVEKKGNIILRARAFD